MSDPDFEDLCAPPPPAPLQFTGGSSSSSSSSFSSSSSSSSSSPRQTLPVFEITDVQCTTDPLTRRRHRFPPKASSPDVQPCFGRMHFRVDGAPWSLDAFLGVGMAGETYAATNTATGKVAAIKFINGQERAQAEVLFLRAMPVQLAQHPNIVTCK